MTAVLFDMFGVIACHQPADACARLEATAQVPGKDFWDSYWGLRQPYDRGDQSGPEYWRTVADSLGVSFDERRTEALIAADTASWSEVDAEMVQFIGELADGGTRIGLLSNIPEELAAHYEKHQPWLRNFEFLAFSCRIGHAKPEPGAYTWCSDAFGLAPEDVLFVDDRQDNVRAAEALGMRAHLFTSLATLKPALAESALRPAGG
ncbi:HAD family phosphatase [Streptomyces piniterrae]|uniref:HAD family phosphatase n=1 Tax=Streptomyces piniterrae TaxID=2571125 RepID=A0A4U0NSF2_9ACTN|nr:HAD family phosphatase [Streptomyces piniterrae]TJZ57390.1 HAD family phosphatase [Streptomyces piniterrae]